MFETFGLMNAHCRQRYARIKCPSLRIFFAVANLVEASRKEGKIGLCVGFPLRFLINKEGLERQINVSDGWMVPRQMGRQKVEIH